MHKWQRHYQSQSTVDILLHNTLYYHSFIQSIKINPWQNFNSISCYSAVRMLSDTTFQLVFWAVRMKFCINVRSFWSLYETTPETLTTMVVCPFVTSSAKCYIEIKLHGSHTFSETKFKDFLRTFHGQNYVFQAQWNRYLAFCRCFILW